MPLGDRPINYWIVAESKKKPQLIQELAMHYLKNIIQPKYSVMLKNNFQLNQAMFTIKLN